MKIKSFAPGHCTIFFQPVISHGKLIGAKGVGICLKLGTTSIAEDSDELEIICNSTEPRTTLAALKMCNANNVKIKIENHLPISQGFGMSSAGTLSALVSYFALRGGKNMYEIAKIAHNAEVCEKTGLGDVAAQITGGICVREEGGPPPYTRVYKLILPLRRVAICIFDGEIKTKHVLDDDKMMRKIIDLGRKCMHEFSFEKTIHNLFKLGYEFGKKTKITPSEVIDIIDNIHHRKLGIATPVMIGNSILCLEPRKELIEFLKKYGNVYTCGVDWCGCRIL